jgi:Xaa-Pro aminopeptidase
MKTQLDTLMQTAHVDALLIVGSAQHNPAMQYFTGEAHVTEALLVKHRGEPPILFHYPMERGEAAQTGLRTTNMATYSSSELLKEAGGDPLRASALRLGRILHDAGVDAGTVAVYGVNEVGATLAQIQTLGELFPALKIQGFPNSMDPILAEAELTKDADEIAHIRRMGQVTTRVVAKTAEFLSGHSARDGVLRKPDGQPLLLGEVKRQIGLWLAEEDVEAPEGVIFSIGRDAGLPHSAGNPEDPMRLGQTIVFDIYPAEAGGGYFYDFTRTWCLGFAPDEVQAVYDQVLRVQQRIIAELEPDAPFQRYQERTCELFEQDGHVTVRQKADVEEGYVHSIGHGLGLHVHERPFSGMSAGEGDRLAANTVFTVEPGLYYPSRGFGVRIEDTLWARPDGTFEVLADYPRELVLPVSGS